MNRDLTLAIEEESKQFQEYYLWLQQNMPPYFFEEVKGEFLTLIARSLIDFELRQNFAEIYLKRLSIVLCLDEPNADLKILHNFRFYGIKNYLSFVSKTSFAPHATPLRIALVYFTEAIETIDEPFPAESKVELKKRTNLSESDFEKIISGMNTRFLNSLKMDMLVLALDMFIRAQTRDNCQYEVIQNSDYKKTGLPSLQIVLAWKQAPKYDFLYHIAHIIARHNLKISRVNATYIDPYSKDTTLIMALGLNGKDDEPAWEATDIQDFLKELVTAKYFAYFDQIGNVFVTPGILSGNQANFLRTTLDFVHQVLLTIDMHLYSYQNCEEALCRHPELTRLICNAFEAKFSPQDRSIERYNQIKEEFYKLVSRLDTGNEINDLRRKNVLKEGMNFVENTLKTNVFQNNKTAFSYRLNPKFLSSNPERFPELPFGVFFIANRHIISFHVRFEDLARGGVRTILTDHIERAYAERNNILTECYNLALTQNKKNKDIPEGGAKAVIFLSPLEKLKQEMPILIKEMKTAGLNAEEIEERLHEYHEEQKLDYLYSGQRAFVRNLVTLINCHEDGTLIANNIVDYWKKPEYIYLGPDENMHDFMIEWIAHYSVSQHYKPGSAFISGKPEGGINHKHYGVTSLGLNIYMIEALKFIGIDLSKDIFTVKISGGPDGDVAGNQIKNIASQFPNTGKIIAITDVSGTINDPLGLELDELVKLVEHGKPIRFYPPEKLSEGAFLLDKEMKKEVSEYEILTKLTRVSHGQVVEEWLSGNEMNQLFRSNVHKTKTDIFIPAGGRPKTLNAESYKDFLDETGTPTSKAIIEGANLYLTNDARTALEKLGVIIIKDSSANKTGVICSSFEVLSGLTLKNHEFQKIKPQLIIEILEILKEKALDEAQLLLKTHKETKKPLSEISEEISKKINYFFHELYTYLETITLSNDPQDPLIKCFLAYCPRILRTQYQESLLKNIPEMHKKAIIACYISAKLVYKRGLDWRPTLVDILPFILETFANQ